MADTLVSTDVPITETAAGMRGESIVSFSKDWSEDPTSNNHVMRLLSKENKVLWLNSISTRTPSLAHGGDVKKIFRKLGSFLKGPHKVNENFWVYTPIVLPFPYHPLAIKLNRMILKGSVRMLRRRMGMKEFQLWTFFPSASEYVGTLGESVSVYYCTDEWSLFTGVNERKTVEAERDLCRKVDVVFATASSLLENRKPLNPEIHLATHGVDQSVFARAMDAETPVHPDLAGLPGPIIGFYGLLEDWVDYDLIEYLAERHPEWSIVLVGKACVDLTRLEKHKNVHLPGRKPHAELPQLCKGFAVGMIPYLLTERLLHVNPIKLREYLSAGLPVVSSALPEVMLYDRWCTIAHTHEEFERGILEALRTDSPERKRERGEAMKAETWEKKVEELGSTVLKVRDAKRSQSRRD